MPGPRDDLLVWIDLEMTGLDPARDVILEIATLITDSSLNLIEEGPCLVVRRSESVLSRMSNVVKEMHDKNGLSQRVLHSDCSADEAESRTLQFLSRLCVPRSAPLCGNSVWTDRMFLQRHMSPVHEHLHHRVIDVSSLKELTRRWHPAIAAAAPQKPDTHRALDDIRASIEELRYYRDRLLTRPDA